MKSYLWFDKVLKKKTKQKFGNNLHCIFIKSELGTNFVSLAFIFLSAALARFWDLCDYLQKDHNHIKFRNKFVLVSSPV